MRNINTNKILRKKRKVRSRIIGKTDLPRVSIYRSSKHIYAQVIDDSKKATIMSETDLKVTEKNTKRQKARNLGIALAKKMLDKKITSAVFDRGQYRYLGRVKEVAEGLREGGVKI